MVSLANHLGWERGFSLVAQQTPSSQARSFTFVQDDKSGRGWGNSAMCDFSEKSCNCPVDRYTYTNL